MLSKIFGSKKKSKKLTKNENSIMKSKYVDMNDVNWKYFGIKKDNLVVFGYIHDLMKININVPVSVAQIIEKFYKHSVTYKGIYTCILLKILSA